MAKLNSDWIVQPHGPVTMLAPGLATVAGEIVMPLGRFPRRMTVATLAGGGTAVWSPIPLDPAGMATIEALGAPAWLVVPGIAHRLDIIAWKARYPRAKVLCAVGAAEAVREAVPVDATSDPFADPDLGFEAVPGVGEREAALLVRRDDGLSLVVNDIVANVRNPHGLGAKVMARLFGFGVHGPQMPRVGRKRFVKDAPALAAWMRHHAADMALARLIPSHGDVIEDGAAADALRTVAESLAR